MNLIPIKVFVHEAFRRLCTPGSILQTALCYLKVIRVKILGLVEKERTGDGVQGEPDLFGKIVQGDLDAEEWQALSPDFVWLISSIWMLPSMLMLLKQMPWLL